MPKPNLNQSPDLTFATSDSSFGLLCMATTARGVCFVGLYEDSASAESALHAQYPHVDLHRDSETLAPMVEAVLRHLRDGDSLDALPLDIHATAFQWRVWHALRAIPYGETRTYAQLAESIGKADSVRAVAAACGRNPAALVIPCHRVLGKDGALTGYKWGITRKQQLLAHEAQRAHG